MGATRGPFSLLQFNIESLVVEVDAQAVVDVLKNNDYVNNVVSPLLDDCRKLIASFRRIQFKHCYRQANRCADWLARRGAVQENVTMSFVSPPVDIVNVFEDDLNGVLSFRMCTIPAVSA